MSSKVSLFDVIEYYSSKGQNSAKAISKQLSAIRSNYSAILYKEDKEIFEDELFQKLLNNAVEELTNSNHLTIKDIVVRVVIKYCHEKQEEKICKYLISHLEARYVAALYNSEVMDQRFSDFIYSYYQDRDIVIALPELERLAARKGFTVPTLKAYTLEDNIVKNIILFTDPLDLPSLVNTNVRYSNMIKRQEIVKEYSHLNGVKEKVDNLGEFNYSYFSEKNVTCLLPFKKLKICIIFGLNDIECTTDAIHSLLDSEIEYLISLVEEYKRDSICRKLLVSLVDVHYHNNRNLSREIERCLWLYHLLRRDLEITKEIARYLVKRYPNREYVRGLLRNICDTMGVNSSH